MAGYLAGRDEEIKIELKDSETVAKAVELPFEKAWQ